MSRAHFGWPERWVGYYDIADLKAVRDRQLDKAADDYWARASIPPRPASEKQVGGNHYKDMAIEPSEFIHRNGIGWLEGNAIKYTCRHAMKGGAQDIDKAIHYLELLKEWQYGHGKK